ncbi:MAG: D-alanyl-D-alanine carboxypeptidase [Ruminococcaceae bacterium]|nr:D-alanyl-D-alanine carboxypeptidase [Oscillospiraceae bacterium]
MFKKIISAAILFFVLQSAIFAQGELTLTGKSAVLIEQSTKNILYENQKDEKLPPASVTKVMTMLLIMEAIDRGKITLEDKVVCSENAASMGGSQIFLEPGEEMSVHELLKAISVVSANDACVMMGEHLSGTIEGFVEMMNKKAKELNMNNTNFVNCTGLPAENHYTTAYDIALMSAELLKYPLIKKYTTIWMDTLRDGQFGLSNTNKLIRYYSGATGLKTGSTDEALFCLSASANRNNMELIAVVLGAPTSKERFADATKLLDYGFAKWSTVSLSQENNLNPVNVLKGLLPYVELESLEGMSTIVEKGRENDVEKRIELPEYVNAPITKGQQIGEVIFTLDGNEIYRQSIVAKHDVNKAGFGFYLKALLKKFFC